MKPQKKIQMTSGHPGEEKVSAGPNRRLQITRGSPGKQKEPASPIRRLNINLPEELFVELERLAKRSNRTMTELVRSSLGLVRVAFEEERRGHKLAVVTAEGEIRKEIVLL